MKICLISSMYPPRISGPSTQTRHFALLLKEHGVTPIVVTFGARNEICYDDDVKVYYLNAHEEPVIGPFLQYINAFSRLRKILKHEKPDIVHHQTGVDYLSSISGFLAKKMGIPSIIKYAGDLVWERLASNSSSNLTYEEVFNSTLKGRFLTLLERFILNNFNLVWATSRFQKDSLIRILRIDNKKIISYPNYIILNTDPLPGISNDKLTILSVCRFARWKRIDNTLRTFAKLNKDNVVLKIVGGENLDLERGLKELTVNLGIQDKVEFVGAVSPAKINDHFRSADIFISSTTYEPFGITFVEAMAAGLPIVASKICGIPDVVPDDEAGFLVEPDNTDEMAEKLSQLIDDPVLRRRIGEYGRQWAKQFDLREKFYIFLSLYQELKDLNKAEKKKLQQMFPIVEGLDKEGLHNYYKNQHEDFSRMYKDRFRQNKQKRRLDIIKQIFKDYNQNNDLILDIGCGDGYAFSYILDGYQVKRYFGVDLSTEKLKKVLEQVKYSRTIVGDGERLPLRDNGIDCILCLETLEHLIDPTAALREVERILKPGGIAILSVPIDSPFQKILGKGMKRLKRTFSFNEHIQIFTIRSINHLLKECGLRVLTKRFCGFNFPLSNLILENLPYRNFASIDNLLCKIPLQCVGVGSKLGFSFGREYLILAIKKT